jgi:uncharacterized protein (TIGR04255 family)
MKVLPELRQVETESAAGMPNDYDSLPRFDRPPVIETVMGVHFKPLPRFTGAHQGVLWDREFRSDFPQVKERPPVEEVVERFGSDRLESSAGIRWSLSDQPDTPRLWAMSDSGEHILQIQKSALLTNWQRPPNVGYLHYSERRSEFERRLQIVDEFLRTNELGQVEPTSCLLTYINHLELDSLSDTADVVQQCLTVWQNSTSDSWLPKPDELRLHFAFPMPADSGRLNVIVNPVVRRQDKQPMIRMELTARGVPEDRSIDSAIRWIDGGHEWIVRGFSSITRPEMHEIWGRTQ